MPDTPAVLANAVTGFATLFSGATALLLTFLVAPQPNRWRAAYAAIVFTGVPTIWFHGFGETFPAKVADVSTNFLVSYLMILAVLGDYYQRRTQLLLGGLMLALNLWATADMIASGAPNTKLVSGGGAGYSIRQLTLITDSLLATILLYVKWAKIPPRARPLLNLQTAWFLGGAWLASFSIHRVDYTVVSYHALWHLVGAFGFLLLWAFNHVRFHKTIPLASESV